jgi:GDP-L-fucose synthase
MATEFDSKIYVAGHQGMVGSAIVRALKANGFTNLVTRTHAELELRDQTAVKMFFEEEKPDQVYLAAAKVGGIYANNTYPAEFIYDNLMIQSNVIHQAFINGVIKLLFLGSSCIYPKTAPQPMGEDALLTGKLEPTNEPYAIAKIAGIKMCESYNRQYGLSHGIDYRCVMPTNLYGPGDNYHSENSHVIPALIKRFHEAKINQLPEVMIWGTGTPRREFLYVDDMAAACCFVMNLDKVIYDQQIHAMQNHVNVGFGSDITVSELALMIRSVIGFEGRVSFDSSYPNGAHQKLIDSSKLRKLGWNPKYNLKDALTVTYESFLEDIS